MKRFTVVATGSTPQPMQSIKRQFTRIHRALGGIRFRLTVWYALVLGGVLIVIGLLLYAIETQTREFTLDSRLTNQAHALREDYNPQTDQITPRDRGSSELALRGDEFVMLFDAEGHLTQQIGPLAADDVNWFSQNLASLTRGTTAETFLNYTLHSGSREVGDAVSVGAAPDSNSSVQAGDCVAEPSQNSQAASLPDSNVNCSPGIGVMYRVYVSNYLEGNTKTATFILGYPTADQSDLLRIGTDYLLLAPLMIVITSLGAYWLAGRAMRPVRTITRTARAIGGTDLSRRLNLSGYDEIAELGATFDQMLGRLEGAFERQRRFTRDASHELRTPLTIVELEVERALSKPRTDAEYVRTLITIQAENVYMMQLVNNLLILARADSGSAALARKALDLSDLALEVAERLTLVARQSEIELIVGDLPELPICGDRLYLTQMLVNLLENAIKYTCGTGKRVTISTGRDLTMSLAWARITDDGPGIPPEHLPHLFERFYRVDPARTGSQTSKHHPGSGLGLSIVQWVTESHSGTVHVQSIVGAGSTFEVRLPLVISPS